MKKLLKIFGIIAILAVIGLSMPSCGDDNNKNNATYEMFYWHKTSVDFKTATSGTGVDETNPEDLINLLEDKALEVVNNLDRSTKIDGEHEETIEEMKENIVDWCTMYELDASYYKNLILPKLESTGFVLVGAKDPKSSNILVLFAQKE